jgi:hypothetical protein
MLGELNDNNLEGVIPRSVNYVFEKIKKMSPQI